MKVLHLLCVMGWVASIFALAAALRCVADRSETAPARDRFVSYGLRAYRLGHHLFGGAVVFGLVLWLFVGIGGPWLHAKLLFVILLLAHFMVGGRRLKRMKRGGDGPTRRWALWYGRLPGPALATIVWLVLGKPF